MEIVSEKGIATEGLYSSQGVRKVGRTFTEMYLNSVLLLQIRKTKIGFSDRYKRLRIIIVTKPCYNVL